MYRCYMKAPAAVLARKGKRLTAQDNAEIIAWHQSGSRNKWMAKTYSVHPTTISKIIKKFVGLQFLDRRRGSGRQGKLQILLTRKLFQDK
mmetsp:Transcript_38159/g.38845  ORF Transcript_38159/g.38845 Transcript_38159/m.38845 type:complete len:90 (+) Transcript_38159:11-280(+)